MTKAQRPFGNQTGFIIKRPFSAEGFHKLDVIGAFNEIGYSKSETRRLLNAGAIKIWDTRVLPNNTQWEWYKRPSLALELIEPRDIFLFGKRLFVDASHVPMYKRIYWCVRPYIERFIEHFYN